jgi:SAM-dependent methyltransferase
MTLQARRRTLLLSAAGLVLGPPRLAWSQDEALPPKLDVPFVPTPQAVVDRMLTVAGVGRRDTLYDLGCGDGRIVVTAASQYGAHGVGIDLNPERIAEARANVNLKLRPKLWSQLKPGARVVSHAFDMGPDWPPERTVEVDGRTIYLWTITSAQKTRGVGKSA